MKTVDIKEARETLAEYAAHGESPPIVVTDHGRPVAALLPVPNADLETVALSTNPEFPALIDRSRERQSREATISSDCDTRMSAIPQKSTSNSALSTHSAK